MLITNLKTVKHGANPDTLKIVNHFVIPYTYKFLRDIIFVDRQFSGFLQFNLRGSLIFQQVYLTESIEVTLIFIIFEVKNFVECKATAKSAKFTSLENLYAYSNSFVLYQPFNQ